MRLPYPGNASCVTSVGYQPQGHGNQGNKGTTLGRATRRLIHPEENQLRIRVGGGSQEDHVPSSTL